MKTIFAITLGFNLFIASGYSQNTLVNTSQYNQSSPVSDKRQFRFSGRLISVSGVMKCIELGEMALDAIHKLQEPMQDFTRLQIIDRKAQKTLVFDIQVGGEFTIDIEGHSQIRKPAGERELIVDVMDGKLTTLNVTPEGGPFGVTESSPAYKKVGLVALVIVVVIFGILMLIYVPYVGIIFNIVALLVAILTM